MKINFLPATLIITACLIFAGTIFAQKDEDKKCKMVIKIQKDDGDTHLDTTITIDDCDEIMNGDFDHDGNFDIDIDFSEDIDINIDSLIENLDIDIEEGENKNITVDVHAVIIDDEEGGKKAYSYATGSGSSKVIIKKNDDDDATIQTITIDSEGEEKIVKKKIIMTGDDEDTEMHIEIIGDEDEESEIWISDDENEEVFVFKGKSIKIIVKDLDEKEKEEINEKVDVSDNNDLMLNNIKFYPNPNNGKFVLDFSLEEEGNTIVRIYDMKGDIVFEEELAEFRGNYKKEIDLSEEGKGVYILKVLQGNKQHSKKIVVE